MTSAPVTVIELTVGRCRGMRRGSETPAEAHVVEEFQAIAVVALANGTALKPPRDVVLADPDLVVALSEAGGVDKPDVVRHLLPDREPRAGISFVGNQLRLDADLAQTRGALNATPELRTDAAGEIRQHLLLRNFEFFAAHLLERAARDQERHDVRFR